MSPQPKWRVSADELAGTTGHSDEDFWRHIQDLRDARAEIDTLQAAVRELRAIMFTPVQIRVFANWAIDKGLTEDSRGHLLSSMLLKTIADKTESVLARTDKLLPEDE